MTYTPFDLPKTITKGGSTTTFGYDGDEQRIRKTTPTSETIYVGDLFEQVTSAGLKEFRYSVYSPERVIAIVTREGNEPGTKYLLTDHLGSVETVTDDVGKVIEKRSNDVFGARRNPKWGDPGAVVPGKTTKGFTGHDDEDEFGLVNMKGRLYDPKIARFTATKIGAEVADDLAKVIKGSTATAGAHDKAPIPPQDCIQFEHLGLRVAFGALRPKPHAARRGSSTPCRATESLCISGSCAAWRLGRRRNLLDLGPRGPSVGASLFEQVQIAEDLPFEVPRQ